MKVIRNLILTVVLLACLGIAGAIWGVPAAIRSGTETISTQTMQVETNVESAGVDYSAGSVRLHGYHAGSPPGFQQPFLRIEKIHVASTVGQLRSDPAEVAEIVIDRPVMTIEHSTVGTNLDKIREALEKRQGRRWKIGKLRIQGAKVRFVVPLADTERIIDLPDIELANITNSDGGPAMMGDVIRQVTQAMLSGGLERGNLPLDLRNKLAESGGLEPIGRIKDAVDKVGEKVKGALDGIFGGKKEEGK